MPTRDDGRATDGEDEQEAVADRIGEVGRDRQRAPADGMQDRVEGEAGAESCRAEFGHGTVKPCGRTQPVEVFA